MKSEQEKYQVVFERDEAGWWVARVLELDGCHTQGRSIAQARSRIREAMELFDVSPDAVIEETIDVGTLNADIQQVRRMRQEAEQLVRESTSETTRLANRLVQAGFSRRDVGELVGVSFQRVHQLVISDSHQR